MRPRAERPKRVQALGGAKNHMVVMPDADLDQATDALMGAAYGSAASGAWRVGWRRGRRRGDKLMDNWCAGARLKVAPAPTATPRWGRSSLASISTSTLLCRSRRKGGRQLVVDGRGLKLQGYEDASFLGGCLFDDVTRDMRIYKEEIFGPVLSVVRHPIENA